MRQQVRARHAARDRAAGGWLLHHPLAAAAGFLDAGDLDHLHPGCNHVEEFADILAHHAQIAATVRTAGARIKLAALPQGFIRDTRAAAQGGCGGLLWRRLVRRFVDGGLITLGHGDQQIFERQFQLLNLALDLFRGFAEGQFLQLGDPQAKGLNQLVVDPQRGRHLGVLRLDPGIFHLQSRDHRLQNGGIIWQIFGMFRHAPDYQKSG